MLLHLPPEDMNSFSVTRTFHPVGQGAFYSEMFDSSGVKFLMVYDCGATNSRTAPKALCKEIKGSFHEDQYDEEGRLIVDVLFLSHFHNDHLNGVAHLAPKTVICPFIDDEDILMLELINHFQPEWNIGAMRDPGSLFGNQTRIIRVAAIDPDPERPYEYSNRPNTLANPSDMVASGTRIGVKSHTVDLTDIWCFIPFNFHYKERVDEFKRLLEEGVTGKCAGGLSFDDFKANPSEFIQRHKAILRTICDTFSGKTNDQSLIVYSGPVDSGDNIISHEYHEIQGQHYVWIERDKSAAIYYGDITLRETLVKSLTIKLPADAQQVGTIQLPHHGSDRSFHESVLYYYDKSAWRAYNGRVLFVMCAGSKSKTHPGKDVMLTLRRMSQSHTVVKESRDSALTEYWLIYYEKSTH